MQAATSLTESTVPSPRRWDRDNAVLLFGSTENAEAHRDELVSGLGFFDDPNSSLRAVLERCGYAALPAEVEVVVRSQKPAKPTSVWPTVEAFVRDSVTIAAPHTVYAANLLMTHASRYVQWCVQEQGWPLDGEVIWSVQAIDLYATDERAGLADGTRRNYRAMLMRISEVLMPVEHGDKTTPLSRKSSAAPYTPVEMTKFRRWVELQTTNVKRDRAMLMLVLCAGAGLKSNEVHTIHPEHVTVDASGIVVHVPGETARDVPLLAEWEEWMVALLERRPADEPLWGVINRKDTNNLLSSFTENTIGNPPNGHRLRNTWLVTHLTAGVPMKDLFRASGFAKFEHLPRLLQYVPDNSTARFRAVLRGEGQR